MKKALDQAQQAAKGPSSSPSAKATPVARPHPVTGPFWCGGRGP